MLQNSSLSSVKKSFDENSSQELSLQSLSEISGGNPMTRGADRVLPWWQDRRFDKITYHRKKGTIYTFEDRRGYGWNEVVGVELNEPLL